MKKDFVDVIRSHESWVASLGKDGKKIVLEEKVMECINCKNIDISQSSFIECVFKKTVMEHWDFYAATLCSTFFESVSIIGSEFVKADLTYVKFYEANIKDTNFSKVDLSHSIIEKTKIQDSKFINALMDSVNFTNVHLTNIDFSGAMIENVLFNDTSFNNLNGLDEAHIKSINIGSVENPVYLKEQEAVLWLKRSEQI